MEDPNLLEESSALMEGSEGGRGAPLRLGWEAWDLHHSQFMHKGAALGENWKMNSKRNIWDTRQKKILQDIKTAKFGVVVLAATHKKGP